ncbi:class I SAM-dependent RNA methyltransferase [Marinospirillum perlucidum]|uniref:class I SAM-dependent RNA methyltransferase n=1 Tax=Marinospirillum perlucidum TaxID=1982602 RepID=UPI000DF18B21|nr:class I SAM-dependent RNA methyltransferase [Marinospirillum perlucidum]
MNPASPAKELPLPPGCPPACPGCPHRQLTAATSQQQKSTWLEQQLAPWQQALQPLQAVEASRRWGYRDRVTLACRWQEDQWQIGMHLKTAFRDEILPIHNCPLHTPRTNHLMQLLVEHLPPPEDFPLTWLVQAGHQITLVVKDRQLPATQWLENLYPQLAAWGYEGLWLHLNPSTGKKIFAKKHWQQLWGQTRSRDSLGLSYGPCGFQQLLPELYQQALQTAARFLAPDPASQVVDLYSGGGASLQLWLAAQASCLGVELGGEAVESAAINAPGASLLRGGCRERLPQIHDWVQAEADKPQRLLYTNPPRTGMEEEVTRWINDDYQPERLAYLSCSAGTLKRDLLALSNYQPLALHPFDFFPQTKHVETLALLQRVNP